MSGGSTPAISRSDSQNTSTFSSQTALPQTVIPSKSVLVKTLLKQTDSIDDVGPERRKLKNEDSSYDSDFDPSEFMGGGSCEKGQQRHEDVSRTVSETLAAEFEDYVTLHHNPGPSISPNIRTVITGRLASASLSRTNSGNLSTKNILSDGTTEGSTHPVPLSSVLESDEYAQQVDFGVKLGYSESLVQLALSKLGLNPDKNELLDELIRLGAGAPRSEGDEDAEIVEVENSPHPPLALALTLRPIIIDGSNVAMSHGNKARFSCKGIRLCVDWFRSRGHSEVLAFVPMWRKEPSRPDSVITDREELQELEKEGVLSFTPSRSCGGKRIVAYDDRYIIKEALKSDGVIVSNDNYRDLQSESPAFRKVIESSLLMYSWVNGRFEPPDDPLGRNGPSLDTFLRKNVPGTVSAATNKESRPCPYGRKCTYGNKCKYIHPERGAVPVKSVTEILQEQKQKHYQDKAKSRESSPGENLRAKSLSLPVSACDSSGTKKPLTRTQSSFPTVIGCGGHQGQNLSEKGSHINQSFLASSDPKVSPSHTPLPGQDSLESLCGSILKDDMSLFSICPSQLTYPPSGSWSTQDPQPANSAQNLSIPFESRVGDTLDSSLGVENLHPKLQRQLSLNPVGDVRLNKNSNQLMNNSPDFSSLFSSSYPLHQNPQLRHQQQQHQLLHSSPATTQQGPLSQHQQRPLRLLESDGLPTRTHVGSRCISPGPTFSAGFGGRETMLQPYFHPPLTRHSSSQDGSLIRPFSQQMLPATFHNPVGRNLSAPDRIRGTGQQQPKVIPHITRLNSTSDSNLNMHVNAADPQQQFTSECFDDSSRLRLPYSKLSVPLGRPNSPGPVGSRPISPQQNASFAQKHPPAIGRQMLTPGSGSHEDERLKIFYHLSQLFPEAQVRSALAQNPEETDPTKICSSILSMTGLRSGQHKATGGIQLPNFGASGLSSLPSFTATAFASPGYSASSHDTNREAARLDAYAKLSKLFSDDQVRNVLMRYPEETDATKLCMYLMALNCQS